MQIEKSLVARFRLRNGVEPLSRGLKSADLQRGQAISAPVNTSEHRSFEEIVIVAQLHQASASCPDAPGGRFFSPQDAHKLSELSSTGRRIRSSFPGFTPKRRQSE